MSTVGQKEQKTQQRVVRLVADKAHPFHLGNREERQGNRNIEPELLRPWLKKRGHRYALIGTVLYELERAAADTSTTLYDRNKDVCSLLLQNWYRQRLRERLDPLWEKWQKALGVEVAECGIKRMKTKWGSCNPEARHIWLNLELAKKPVQCLEYLIVHELAHLIDRHHNDRFTALMDKHLPDWKARPALLNAQSLAHGTWEY
jgi:predicted metal-dependent hydrolase